MAEGKLVTDPVYLQLTNILRKKVVQGDFKIGSRFLTEREIGEEYGVSRITANRHCLALFQKEFWNLERA